MAMRADLLKFFSLHFWGSLPASWQRALSRVYARIYTKSYSKHIIGPYCKLNYKDPNYLDQFRPASGNSHYLNFQDFFTREYKNPPKIATDAVWPCEGLLCEHGKVSETNLVKVKGQKRHLRTIFGEGGEKIPNDYYFSNVFLHNNNYHRIHSPVTATVERIEHIPGDLVVLRPWIYKNDPSIPALINERINIDLITDAGKRWFLSIVGGPAVGSIVLPATVRVGTNIGIGQELATFLLGSTCCIAAPIPVQQASIGQQVAVGQAI